MSKDDVKDFFVSLAQDQAISDDLAAMNTDQEFIDKVFQYAGQRGVTLDRADVEGYLADLRAARPAGEQQLSDEQLEDVAGGYTFCQVNRIPKPGDEGKGGPTQPGKLP